MHFEVQARICGAWVTNSSHKFATDARMAGLNDRSMYPKRIINVKTGQILVDWV